MTWKERFRAINYKRLAIGLVLGGIGGYLYYHYIGCASGTCSITSDPLNSSLYGMLIGATFFYKEKHKKKLSQE